MSIGETICSNCQVEVFHADKFSPETQLCHQCLYKYIVADSETDSSLSSQFSSSQISDYTDNSTKSSPLNAIKLELGMLSDLNPILSPVLIIVFTCRRGRYHNGIS